MLHAILLGVLFITADSSASSTIAPLPFNYQNARDYMFENLRYPKEAFDRDIEGDVVVRFMITSEGTIDSVKIIKKVHPLLDDEAKRLIIEMPKWQPFKRDGKAVSVYWEIPVIFEILRKENQAQPVPDTIRYKLHRL
ncbi:MAG: energy transducer TonB [Culturomica sp.]|jgi:protein TonB|nr:energy transducer TonB [Culturomica sp.]